MNSLLPTLRHAAPRLSRQFFRCSYHQCLYRVATRPDRFKDAPPKNIRAFKSNTRRASAATSANLATETGLLSSITSSSQSNGQKGKKTNTGFFPSTSEKSVAYWLLGSAASVFGIVVFGGLTRLTESGYITLFRIRWQGAKCSKPEYYGMEASDGQPTPNDRRGLGV